MSTAARFALLGLAAAAAGFGGTAIHAQEARSARVAPGETLLLGTLGDELAYDVVEIRARAGSEITIEFVNNSGGMPHNVVFVHSESDINPVGIAALEASDHEYIPQQELRRIFGYTGMAGPGENLTIRLSVPEEPGIYPYICTYPGHFTVMQGRLIAL